MRNITKKDDKMDGKTVFKTWLNAKDKRSGVSCSSALSCKKQAGFSLIELSIVIIIIGLLVSGVAGGQSLISQARLRSVLTEAREYEVNINAFKLKYDAWPGDMADAHDYFGDDCDSTASNCNGDGDSIIEFSDSAANESWRMWQHLVLSGIIEGSYTGENGSSGIYHSAIGVNVPAGPMKKTGWIVKHGVGTDTTSGGSVQARFVSGQSLLVFGGHRDGNNDISGSAVKNIQDTYMLDLKSDDGLPHNGKLRSHQGYVQGVGYDNCLVSANTSYDVSETSNMGCTVGFKLL